MLLIESEWWVGRELWVGGGELGSGWVWLLVGGFLKITFCGTVFDAMALRMLDLPNGGVLTNHLVSAG